MKWGHRHSGTESGHVLLLPEVIVKASMGPPPVGNGKGYIHLIAADTVDELQWSHRLSAMESWHRYEAYCQAWELQWGHRLSAMESTTNCTPTPTAWASFNGATAFRRWKATYGRVGLRVRGRLQWGHRLSAMEILGDRLMLLFAGDASMEPPPFGDGDAALSWRGMRSSRCFNGAIAFRRWRSMWTSRPTLQRRRGFNGAIAFRRWRSLGDRLMLLFAGDASMGPPPFGDGYAWHSEHGEAIIDLLQWGHRLSAMETARSVPSLATPCTSFNGATAFRRWR